MKARWRSESLRLRITPAELAALLAGEGVEEEASFPGGWRVRIEPGPVAGLSSPTPGTVVVALGPADRAALSDPATEGVYFRDGAFAYFVEKDFPCIHPRPKEAQESTETFAPPEGFADRHRCPPT